MSDPGPEGVETNPLSSEKTDTIAEDKSEKKPDSIPCTTCAPVNYSCSCPSHTCKSNVIPSQPPVTEAVFNNVQGHGIPNFFGRIRERNLTFCLDTSGSMYLSLRTVKDQLAEFLVNLAAHPLPTKFNLVEFSTEVTQWSDKMVTCTPQTIAVATDWINGLEAKTGTNTLDALMTAFKDDYCDAVVLITDGMPDQNTEDILNQVSLVSDNRPVHCYYIRNGIDPDDFSTEFLQDLAMETYGSFHVITIAKHGAIERITPIYRAEAAAERIIRTTSGTTYPSNIGNQGRCSVTTSLDQPVEYVVEKVGPDYIIEHDAVESYPSSYTTTHQHPYARYGAYYPYHGPSRYHMNDSWPKTADKIIDVATCNKLPSHVSPGPGSIIIGTNVLARRQEDGYFYKGKIKSQIFDKKFLVEFGPCRHGKFRETTYQETYLYDIMSLDDALRHPVLTGDKVLSPWEPDADRYAPGTILEGQEKRSSPIGDDAKLVVSLDHDGRSVRLTKDLAVWIPAPLHERITFELKLPANVRKEIITTDDYPLHNLPGYPRSGVQPYPEDFDRYEEVTMERSGADGSFHEKGMYRTPYFVPLYPVHYKKKAPISAVTSEAVEELIPGTGLTKDQLNEKVVRQLMEHKMMLEEIKKDQATLRDQILSDGNIDKLLTKRSQVSDNTLGSTKKSVTFGEDTRDYDAMDSGCSVGDVLSDLDLSDFEFDNIPEELRCEPDGPVMSRKCYRRKLKREGKLPPWKYWKSKPAPSLMESNNFGKFRVGPFRECLMANPMEARASKYSSNGHDISQDGVTKQVRFSFDGPRHGAHRLAPSITDLTPLVLHRIEKDKLGKPLVVDVEWTCPMGQNIPQTPGRQGEATMQDSMGYQPRPPALKPRPQSAGVDISLSIGAHDSNQEIQKNRRNTRRQRVIAREKTWETTRVERAMACRQMEENARERVVKQLKADWAQVKEEQVGLKASREAKQAINAKMLAQTQEQRAVELTQDDQRIQALRNRRVHRETEKLHEQYNAAMVNINRQATKEQNQMHHWANVNLERMERDNQQAANNTAKQRAHLNRLQHFRDLETKGQQQKTRTNQVNEQRNAMTISSIFT